MNPICPCTEPIVHQTAIDTRGTATKDAAKANNSNRSGLPYRNTGKD